MPAPDTLHAARVTIAECLLTLCDDVTSEARSSARLYANDVVQEFLEERRAAATVFRLDPPSTLAGLHGR